MKRANASDSPEVGGCRDLAVRILTEIELRKAYADVLLDQSIKTHPLSDRDRNLLTHLVYGTLRWRGKIDWTIGPLLSRPARPLDPYLQNLLRLSIYQILYLSRVPDYAAVHQGVELAKRAHGNKAGGFVNAVLRSFLQGKKLRPIPDIKKNAVEHLAITWSHPQWLVKRWLAQFGLEETENLLRANINEPSLVLGSNCLKITRDDLLNLFRGKGMEAAPTPWSPQGISLRPSGSVERLPGYGEGLFQVQGEASQLVGYLLAPQPGERVWDTCAAPGGKTLHLAELMDDRGEVIATDVSAKGLERISENMQRLGVRSVRLCQADLTKESEELPKGLFDRILVDAPCSGLGMLRSHPEAKWNRNERDILRLRSTQNKILHRASLALKAGGVLLYATCTLTREENEDMIKQFLENHDDYIVEEAGRYLPSQAQPLAPGNYLLALPHKHGTEGFFAARLKRLKNR